MNTDYENAKKLGLTQSDRWSEGKRHHPMSKRLVEFLAEHDFHDYNDYFSWKVGGDGDNGETLAFQMDAFFELLDTETLLEKKKPKLATCPNCMGDWRIHGCDKCDQNGMVEID